MVNAAHRTGGTCLWLGTLKILVLIVRYDLPGGVGPSCSGSTVGDDASWDGSARAIEEMARSGG